MKVGYGTIDNEVLLDGLYLRVEVRCSMDAVWMQYGCSMDAVESMLVGTQGLRGDGGLRVEGSLTTG